MTLTNRQFARWAITTAKYSLSAGLSATTFAEDDHEPASPAYVEQYLRDMRGRLDRIEAMVNRETPLAHAAKWIPRSSKG